jgi:hypothetical protein
MGFEGAYGPSDSTWSIAAEIEDANRRVGEKALGGENFYFRKFTVLLGSFEENDMVVKEG